METESGEVCNLSTYEPNKDEANLLYDLERIDAEDMIERNALLYIAGYVAHRYRNKFTELGCSTKTLPNAQSNFWVSFIFRGNCIYPSEDFQEASNIMEREFKLFHSDTFNKEAFIFDRLTDIVCNKTNNNFAREVVACLVRTRTYIRLRKINKEITNKNILRKNRKLYKICNKQ
ncbi:hypothetical protein EAI_07388 [Harpegnathos saltator]|uniref:Transposable element P transposase-like C-terminal domain-containing protein n=1 Tax=Harpegnathos saltator TaxID=610380 RepID=E2BDI0_HARSA|nr:hypothetical protein EAI_07388 [Harpegnathos saltator]